MIKVRALFFAHLRDMAGGGDREFELSEGTTVNDLADQLAILDVRFNGLLRYARPAINGEWAIASAVLRDGDEIGFLPPSSGG
jgi:molybdopterin converting factor small subunit